MRKGTHQKQEAIEMMRKSKIGKKDSPETIEKKRLAHLGENNAFYGKKHSQKTIELLKGPKSEIHKQHLSEAKKGRMPANIEILKNSRKGKTNSDFQKQRVKDALTGLKRSEETNELNRIVHTGLVQSKEAREKNSIAQRGEKNHAWKGGVTVFNESIRSSSKYLAWRDAVYKRDNYTDVITGERGNGNLNAHHIMPFAEIIEKYNITTFEEAMACEELWDVSNGITMIEANHILYHARTGKPE
jgi:hypothetical protein